METEAFTSLMTSLVRDDDNRLSPGDVSTALALVINRYNADRPRRLTQDVEVGEAMVLQTPDQWTNKRSSILSIEAPIGRNPPSYVIEDYFYVYDLPDGDVELRLLAGVVGVGELVRVRYTASHADPLTFDEDDCEALACLGAAILCDQVAALYGHDTDTTVQADSVQHNDKGRNFAARARDYRARYESKFGKPTSTNAASAVARIPSPSRTGMRNR